MRAASVSRAFPETTVLSITTHGEFRLNQEIASAANIKYDVDGIATVLPTFNINPRIREFYKYNAVVPEVLSYVAGDDVLEDPKNVERISRSKGGYEAYDLIVGEDVALVNSHIREIVNETPFLERTNLDRLAQEISTKVTDDIKHIESKIRGWKSDLEKKKKSEELDETETQQLRNFNDYINNAAKGYNLVNCLANGRKMLNKTFVLMPENRSTPSEDWAITSINDPFNQRKTIFDEVYNNAAGVLRSSSRTGRKSITLEQIVNYLADNGVERLIIVDLTCCPFLGPYVDNPDAPDTEYTERTARLLRRGILGKIGYGGKKSRRRRSNKKRTIRKRTIRKKRSRRMYKK